MRAKQGVHVEMGGGGEALPAGYAVLSLLDGRREWHYPALVERDAAGLPRPLLFTRATREHPPVRFSSRARAVKFARDDATLAQQLARRIERMLADNAKGA